MANNESIIALQNFINSSAFGLMPQSTQDEIRNNLATMLQKEQTKVLDNVKECIVESVSQKLADSDIEFSFVIERKNKIVTIKEYQSGTFEVIKPQEETPEEETEEKEGRTFAKSVGFKVLFPDGKEIKKNNAKNTFVQALVEIGLDKIVDSGFTKFFAGYNLIGKEERTDAIGNWQLKVGDWYIYTFMDNDQKVSTLMQVSEHLNLGLRIIWDDGTEYDYSQAKSSIAQSKVFKVEFPDGEVICENKAVLTLAYAIRKIGLEKVAARPNQKTYSDYYLVDRRLKTDDGKKWQQEVDGWYVFTFMNNQRKAQILNDLSEEMELGLRVYIDGELVSANSQDSTIVIPQSEDKKKARKSFTANHDKTKFSLNGADFTNKRRFAWQVVKTYIEKNPTVTYSELQDVFLPEFTSKRLGVVRSIIDMPTDMPESEYPQRYLMKDDELIELADGDIITVCIQWNPERLANMIELAEKQGWSVRKAIDGVLIEEQPNTSYQTPEEEKPQSVAKTNAEGSTFGVTFADGSYIEGDSSYETFLLTLKKIGLVRIPDVGITYGNINLVSVMEKDADKQIKIDGVYVYKNLNDEQMMNALQQISDYYYMDLEIGTEEE